MKERQVHPSPLSHRHHRKYGSFVLEGRFEGAQETKTNSHRFQHRRPHRQKGRVNHLNLGKTPEIALPKHKFPVLALVFFEIPKMTLHVIFPPRITTSDRKSVV